MVVINPVGWHMCFADRMNARMHSLPLAGLHRDTVHSAAGGFSTNAVHIQNTESQLLSHMAGVRDGPGHRRCERRRQHRQGHAGDPRIYALFSIPVAWPHSTLLSRSRQKWRQVLRCCLPLQGLLTAPGPTMLNGQENPIVDVRDVALAHLRAAELPHASGWNHEASRCALGSSPVGQPVGLDCHASCVPASQVEHPAAPPGDS